MYAGGGVHELREPCRSVLERVVGGELDAATSAEVVQEILHRFGAVGSPLVGREMASATLDLFAPVVTITHAIMRRTVDLVARYTALPARDLVHVATCIELGITEIVSPDAHFDAVREIIRIPPGQIPGPGT